MIAVTTFSKSGYGKYAKKTLESACKFWPTKIIVYLESPIDFEHEKVEKRNFFDIEGVMNFYQNIKHVPICHGRTPQGYNYNYDLWKFSRKMFAQWDVMKDYKGKVIWLDADCYIRKEISEKWLEDLFDGQCLAYLGRDGFYTETGFVGFDTEHPDFDKFLNVYIAMLQRGLVFQLKRWHDCEMFDVSRRELNTSGNDLSPFFRMPNNGNLTLNDLDVFSKSILSEYIVHKKGGKKKSNALNG